MNRILLCTLSSVVAVVGFATLPAPARADFQYEYLPSIKCTLTTTSVPDTTLANLKPCAALKAVNDCTNSGGTVMQYQGKTACRTTVKADVMKGPIVPSPTNPAAPGGGKVGPAEKTFTDGLSSKH